MKEIKAIIEAYDLIDTSATKAALATVVRVEGSSYRRTGARMLVMDNGVWVGGISGGCLEGDALKRARLAMAKSVSTLITYDTTDDDAHQIGVGLGCNGIIDVLFTPLHFGDPNNPVEILKSCVASNRQTNVLITITGARGNWTSVKTGDVIRYNSAPSLALLEDASIESQFADAIHQQLAGYKSLPQHFVGEDEKSIEAFIEILPPEINVVVMGYQYDVYPLTRLVKEIGWRVTIVTNLQKLNSNILKMADAVLPADQFSDLSVDEQTIIVLMSHDYKTDKSNLPLALSTPARYIGVLGPRSRFNRMLRELEAEGQPIAPGHLSRIHAPIGLDIGAVTPEEIALSLIAEVRASLSGRGGGYLRDRTTSIHERN